MNTGMLFWSFIIGTIGLGYFIFGKKGSNIVALISGIIMMGYPYFVTNIWISILIGLLLIVAPFIINF